MVATATIVLTGCGGTVAEPTGDELYERAESLYMDFRTKTNAVLAAVHDGPWDIADGGYGMSPSGVGCGDGWKFDLTRSTTIDPAVIDDKRAAAAAALVSEGFEVENMDLGSGEVTSSDVIVREQDVYSLLTVTFVNNGNVLVTATTPCNPGDKFELGERLFGTETLRNGYLPQQESPSDPLFFGITPGDPQFLP